MRREGWCDLPAGENPKGRVGRDGWVERIGRGRMMGWEGGRSEVYRPEDPASGPALLVPFGVGIFG